MADDLTDFQQSHLDYVLAECLRLVDAKYRKGAAEHAGQTDDMRAMTAAKLVDAALDEAVDQVVYLLSLRAKLKHGQLVPPPQPESGPSHWLLGGIEEED